MAKSRHGNTIGQVIMIRTVRRLVLPRSSMGRRNESGHHGDPAERLPSLSSLLWDSSGSSRSCTPSLRPPTKKCRRSWLNPTMPTARQVRFHRRTSTSPSEHCSVPTGLAFACWSAHQIGNTQPEEAAVRDWQVAPSTPTKWQGIPCSLGRHREPSRTWWVFGT